MEENSIFDNLQIDEVEISYGQRVLASLIDGLFEFGGIVIFYPVMPEDLVSHLFETIPYLKYIIAFAIIFGYRLILISLIGKTIGMKIFRIKYLNKNLLPLTLKERLIAVVGIRTKKIKFYKSR